MDRSNGGNSLAPPRPPKLLPRIHRPRVPEPTMMNETIGDFTVTSTLTSSSTATTAETTTTTINSLSERTVKTPQCTSPIINQRNNNNNSNNRLFEQKVHQNSINNLAIEVRAIAATASAGTTRTLPVKNNNYNNNLQPNINSNIINNNNITNNISGNNNNNYSKSSSKFNNNINNNIDIPTRLPKTSPLTSCTIPLQPEDYQIHHLTFLPQRVTPTTSTTLRRNGSHISTLSSPSVSASTTASSSSSLITATNSFTRRRPQSPLIGISSQSMATTNISNSNNNNNISNSSTNSLSHFHSVEPVPTSPVTLAQPRSESERFVNEYVDTPLRNTHQLQHATRIQHPAGQHDSSQTTTHHLLLLPQRELRQQQQEQQQQHPSNRLTSTAGSVNAMTGVDGIDGFLHSQNPQQQQQLNKTSSFSSTTALGTTTDKINTNFHTSTSAQPITKQPATSIKQSTCKFAKELPALDELLDFHNISTGISTAQGMVSVVSGASPLASPIIIGSSSDGPSSLNPITCPRCGRCRCEQCQSPRPLPQTWVCNKTCLCSAESIIDYASCLCCAKALFYHCARDNDMDCDDGSSTPCVDNPCSCGPYKRTQRWGWLGALSLVLPCLWCYWPMRGCVTLFEKCYGRFAKRGCRCQQIGSTSSMLPITNSLNVNCNNITVLGNSSTIHVQDSITSKSLSHHHHHHSPHHHSHHSDCSNANRILNKSDPATEKRLLDTSPEY